MALSVLLLVSALAGPAQATSPLPEHDVHAYLGITDDGQDFVALGRARTHPNARVFVLRQVDGGPWKRYRSPMTTDTGGFRARVVGAGRNKYCVRVVVPADDDHRRTLVRLGCVSIGEAA